MLHSASRDFTHVSLEDFPSWADRFVAIGETSKLASLCPSTIWEKSRTGEFPRPYKISMNRTAWSFQEIQKWVADKKHTALANA